MQINRKDITNHIRLNDGHYAQLESTGKNENLVAWLMVLCLFAGGVIGFFLRDFFVVGP